MSGTGSLVSWMIACTQLMPDLINGNAQVGRVEPLAQIHRICPHLQSWEQVTRFVQARPQDAERVRKYAEAYMLRGAKKAFDAGIL